MWVVWFEPCEGKIYFGKNLFYIIFDIIFDFKSKNMVTRKYTLLEVYLLATAFGKSPQTISRWINKNDDRLTSEKAKKTLLKKK